MAKYFVVGRDPQDELFKVSVEAPNEKAAEEIVKSNKSVITRGKSKGKSGVITDLKVFLNEESAENYHRFLRRSSGTSRRKHFDSLSELKEQLFDAPGEVKGAYNKVVNYFASKPTLEEALKELRVIVKDKLFYDDRQLKFIAAYAIMRFPFITSIEIRRSRDYSYSNEKVAPTNWTPKLEGLEFKVTYEGRKENLSNNLNAVLAVKEGIRALEGSYLSSADHLFIFHSAGQRIVNVHYDRSAERLLMSPEEALKKKSSWVRVPENILELVDSVKLENK